MYLEQRVKTLEEQVSRLEKQLMDVISVKQFGKPVLRFYNVEVPHPWEDCTTTECRVAVNGKTLLYFEDGGETEVLEYYQPWDWLNALLLSVDHIPMLAHEKCNIVTLANTLAETKKESTLQELKDIVAMYCELVYDENLEVILEDFEIVY